MSDDEAVFAIGDKVICVDATLPVGKLNEEGLAALSDMMREGRVYTVTEAQDWRKSQLGWSLQLAEAPVPGLMSWNSARFRHVHDKPAPSKDPHP